MISGCRPCARSMAQWHIEMGNWTRRFNGNWWIHGYGSIPIDTFLMGWTTIYQLFWGSLGTRVLTHSHITNTNNQHKKQYQKASSNWKSCWLVIGGVDIHWTDIHWPTETGKSILTSEIWKQIKTRHRAEFFFGMKYPTLSNYPTHTHALFMTYPPVI